VYRKVRDEYIVRVSVLWVGMGYGYDGRYSYCDSQQSVAQSQYIKM